MRFELGKYYRHKSGVTIMPVEEVNGKIVARAAVPVEGSREEWEEITERQFDDSYYRGKDV